jgi:hypothetical protein
MVILEFLASLQPRNGVDLQNQLPKIAAAGKRNLVQQTLEILSSGYDSPDRRRRLSVVKSSNWSR